MTRRHAPVLLLFMFMLFMLPVQASSVTVSGRSASDPYDRILSLSYGGVEVARIITPLHRDGSLPDSFSLTLPLPFSVPARLLSPSFAYEPPGAWAVSVSGGGGGSQPDIVPVMSPTREMTELPIGFVVPYTGTVYLLASGGDLCEAVPNVSVQVDGKDVSTVFVWHTPAETASKSGDIQAVAIPYIILSLAAGAHTLEYHGCYGPVAPSMTWLSTVYVLTSAFEVLGQTGGPI